MTTHPNDVGKRRTIYGSFRRKRVILITYQGERVVCSDPGTVLVDVSQALPRVKMRSLLMINGLAFDAANDVDLLPYSVIYSSI